MPLTDTAVRQAKPADRDYTLTDGDGLSLFVAANGTKSWHFRFSWHGKQPRITTRTPSTARSTGARCCAPTRKPAARQPWAA